MELSGTGIRCTEINPGRVDTEFFEIAFDANSAFSTCSSHLSRVLSSNKQTNKQTFITQYRLDTYYYDNAWFLGWSKYMA